ncbi:37429_t:CDS:2, partial [Gigaspora margarita]
MLNSKLGIEDFKFFNPQLKLLVYRTLNLSKQVLEIVVSKYNM